MTRLRRQLAIEAHRLQPVEAGDLADVAQVVCDPVDDFVAGLASAVSSLPMGDPNDADTDDTVRSILASIIGDVAFYAGVDTGAVLGSLNAKRAQSLGLRIVRGAVVDDVAPVNSHGCSAVG